MDHKRNNEIGDEEDEYSEDDDFATDEWTGDEETVNIDYGDDTEQQGELEEENFTLDNDDESYSARNASDLAEIQ